MNNLSPTKFNHLLRSFRPKSPTIFTFHINWKVYENFKLSQFNYVQQQFKNYGLMVEMLPIITSKNSSLDKRVKQFKIDVERIVDKYQQKANVIGYSFGGFVPRAYIGYYNGGDFINTLLTIGTPNKGSLMIELLLQRNLERDMCFIEPIFNGLGVHRDWLIDEYSPQSIEQFQQMYSPQNVKYLSVGGRRDKLKCSETLRFTHELLYHCDGKEHPSDGLICVEDNFYGEHLINFDADHFELIGMRPNVNPKQFFELYANAIKSNDPEFISQLTNESDSLKEEKHMKNKKFINEI
jgi:hypothetical protein